VLEAPVRPAFLPSLVALLSAPALAVNVLPEFLKPGQICFAPKPHGPAIAYAELGGLKFFAHHPAVQGHYCNTRCFGSLLRVAGLYHIGDIYNIFKPLCKAFCFGHLSPLSLAEFVTCAVQANTWQVVWCLKDLSYAHPSEAANRGWISQLSTDINLNQFLPFHVYLGGCAHRFRDS
jgi:hypothetical protein